MAKKKKRTTIANTESPPVSGRTFESAAVPIEPAERVCDDAWSESGSRFWPAATAILILAIVLRQWKLGDAPFHPDEAIHANFALNFAGYSYDPIYHGPLLYHLVASVFGVMGDSDFSARLVPSLLGIGLIAVVIGPARKFLGERGALWIAALLAISPVIVSYSRRLLHDPLVWLLTLGAVICFQSARETDGNSQRGAFARIGLATCVALLFTTKANAFFILAMLIGFWLMTAWQSESTPESGRTFWNAPLPFWIPIAALGFASLVSVWALRGDDNQIFNERVLALASIGAVALVWEWLRRAPQRDFEIVEIEKRDALMAWIAPLLALGAAIFLFTFLFGHGTQWFQTHDLAGGWREAWGSPPVRGSKEAPGALNKMLAYWGGQQGKPRLAGRHDYYLVLMALYELPILLTALAGIVHASRKRTPFTDLLLWWALTSWLLYALANEKVPWLMSNVILPLALLGGVWLAQWRPRTQFAMKGFALACLCGAIYLGRNTWATNFERAGDNREPLFYAQVPEGYRDALLEAMEKTRGKSGDIWYHKDKTWPTVWYLRKSSERLGAAAPFGSQPPMLPLRFVVQLTPTDWENKANATDDTRVTAQELEQIKKRFNGWPSREVDFLNWPRASWGALSPPTWARWWWSREATQENGVLSEWSHSPAVVSTKP